eukprot:EG_transcript_3382
MQVLTPMTLYDSTGRGLTVYAPSTLTPGSAPPAPQGAPTSLGGPYQQQPPMPAGWQGGGLGSAGTSTAVNVEGHAGTFHLTPMASQNAMSPMTPAMGYRQDPAGQYPSAPLPHPYQAQRSIAPPMASPLPPHITAAHPGGPAPPHHYPGVAGPAPAPAHPAHGPLPPALRAGPPAPHPVVHAPPPPQPAGVTHPPAPVLAQPEQDRTTPAGRRPAPRARSGTNVYISNLPEGVTKEDLEQLFTPHGTVLSCRVAKKPGQCPIGFVQFTDAAMAQAAVTAVNGMMMDDGRFIRVKLADRDKDKGVISGPSPDLYICNLPPEWSYAELHATFSIYGRILSLTIFKDSGNGGSPGSGMVRYSTTGEAAAAIQALNRRHLPNMDRPLEVKFAESRAEKDRRIASRMDGVLGKGASGSEGSESGSAEDADLKHVGMEWPGAGDVMAHTSHAEPAKKPLDAMCPMEQFSRLMNLCNDAKATLPPFAPQGAKGLQYPDGTDGAFYATSPTKSLSSIGNSSDGIPQSFWDSVQGMLRQDDVFEHESLSCPPAGVAQEEGLTVEHFASALDLSLEGPGGNRVWKNKRKQRRAIA